MTEKEMRKLSRLELLELFVEKSKEVERLEAELAQANKKLEDRRLLCEQTGNIAQAALEINHIFEQCQQAADDYLASVRSAVKPGQ